MKQIVFDIEANGLKTYKGLGNCCYGTGYP